MLTLAPEATEAAARAGHKTYSTDQPAELIDEIRSIGFHIPGLTVQEIFNEALEDVRNKYRAREYSLTDPLTGAQILKRAGEPFPPLPSHVTLPRGPRIS